MRAASEAEKYDGSRYLEMSANGISSLLVQFPARWVVFPSLPEVDRISARFPCVRAQLLLHG